MWIVVTLIVSLIIGIFSFGIIGRIIRKFSRNFLIEELKFSSLKRLKYSSSTGSSNLINSKFKFPINSSDSNGFIRIQSFNSLFIFELVGFKIFISDMKLKIKIDSLNVLFNSNFFISQSTLNSRSNSNSKPKPKAKNKKSKSSMSTLYSFIKPFIYSVFRSILKFLEISFQKICVISTIGEVAVDEICTSDETNISSTSVVESIWIENLEISNEISLESLKVEQITVNSNHHVDVENILEFNNLTIAKNSNFDEFRISIYKRAKISLNVKFLFFISLFLKSTITEKEDEDDDISDEIKSKDVNIYQSLPWPVLVYFKIPEIDFKLMLPETESTIKYFKWLQFRFLSLDFQCFLSKNNLPKFTAWLGRLEIVAKIDEKECIGSKNFCPVDIYLSRGPKQVAGQCRELIIAQKILLTNWSVCKNQNRTSLPGTFISEWIASILNGSPSCSIHNEMDETRNYIKPELNMSGVEALWEKETSLKNLLTLEFFQSRSQSHDQEPLKRTIFGILDQIDFYVPFEFPISSLIDHSVVLFKAGWRPLSKKTEQGYWIGDGDKFLKQDWALNLQTKRSRIRIEDDAFETKISAISHFQRTIAESRSRLEPEILSKFPSDANKPPSISKMQNLAKIIAVTTDHVTPDQSMALIELQKALFSEYRNLVSKSHLLTDWPLIDLSIEDFKVSLSWSPDWLGENGNLSTLLNQIEHSDQITPDAIDSLSTFIGGFFDISGNAVQLNLRNYSRPILIAPDLRIIGPMFLVEAGVKDPDVLIKFPVRVLPPQTSINLNFKGLPLDGTVNVLRTILPLKMYHCVHATISQPELVQATISPYWLGCIALLDRVIDRFVKASTEDPSPPLPGWDKLRYNVLGCHSRLTISSPCMISRITDSDPLSCAEIMNLSFPHGVEIGLAPASLTVLKCPEASLSVDSQHLYRVRAALEKSGPLHLWDLDILQESQNNYQNFRNNSVDSDLDFLSRNNLIPIIKFSKTELQVRFEIKNVFNEVPSHHWTVRPVARSNTQESIFPSAEKEPVDTFKTFRSKSIAIHLGGVVGNASEIDSDPSKFNDIRFLYYREIERWISRSMLAPFSDIDCVKRGPLHQSAAIPEIQQRTSFSSVFTEFHISIDFSDLFICRILNFSSPSESQALWSASHRSSLNMDWRRGIVDRHGREDWVYYYGELEFLDVQFCVTSTNENYSKDKAFFEKANVDFPLKISGVHFHNLLRAPRLFYFSLDETCFQYDPESLNIQCETILKRRAKLLTSLKDAIQQFNQTPSFDLDRLNQLSIAIESLKKRQEYFDSFLEKAKRTDFKDQRTDLKDQRTDFKDQKTNFKDQKTNFRDQKTNFKDQNTDFKDQSPKNEDDDFEFVDTTHFEIYNAQLVWNLSNRDIVFKFIDELIVQQKKWFSQSRTGQLLMRKMSQPLNFSDVPNPVQEIPDKLKTSFNPKNITSPGADTDIKEAINLFFESLLNTKCNDNSSPNSNSKTTNANDNDNNPFTALPEINEKFARKRPNNDYDFRCPIQFRDFETISVPRVIDVSFFNPQLCFFTPTHSIPGVILVTAREAKVEFSPIFDRRIDLKFSSKSNDNENEENNEKRNSEVVYDAKIGTRTRISLQKSSIFCGSKINFPEWPAAFLKKIYIQELNGLQRLTTDTEIILIYDVSNAAYRWTEKSPKLRIFGHGDILKFTSNGLSLTTTSENFSNFLDVILNLLVYRDLNQTIRSEKLENLLHTAKLSDRHTFATKMETCRVSLDLIRYQLLNRQEFEISHRAVENLINSFDQTERELALIGQAMRLIQASRDEEELNQHQRRIRLTLHIVIDRIQWSLLVLTDESGSSGIDNFNLHFQPICNISLRGISNRWISKEDGSMENTFEIGSANFINQLPNPFYRNVLRPFDLHNGQNGLQLKATVDYGCLLRFYAKSRFPANGIVVLDHVEVDLSPMQFQLTFDIATQIYKFFIPESIKKKSKPTEDPVSSKNLLPRTLSSQPRASTQTNTSTSVNEQLRLATDQNNEQNVMFVYVKVPPSQHLVSYKGSGSSSLLDINKFILSLPEMEYQNRLWSWPEFFNQLRRDIIIVLLKNAGSLFKDKIKKLGQKNVPDEDGPDDQDEIYLRTLARKEKLNVLDNHVSGHIETPGERKKKNLIVFGKKNNK